MTLFNKLLIANRGEIACRVIRTAQRLGIRTVAVYSDADAEALHVRQADQAVAIGPAPAAQSYLNIDAVVDAALRTGADAIHPGYGFLSENPAFVDAVEAAGLIFIGPSAASIRAMGLKDAAKILMEKAGVPVVPGYHGEAQEIVVLAGKAHEIGYPVLIKARAGGGGRGMRLVEDSSDFADELAAAKREAKAAFGDERVLIEKFVNAPRHIEVQIFGDSQGNVVHLFERDCSAQRRHQKVLEEAPAPGMNDAMRQAMTEAAVKAAQAIGYCGAGTVEFIVDGSAGLLPDRFWFMEMNTRLQVEHPVTEMVTGVDMVEWQLRVATGETLPLPQNRIVLSGHALEARIYAEDATRDFLPATGQLHHLRFPVPHEIDVTCRIETGVSQNDTISTHYDPMIAKMIAWGTDRTQALQTMRRILAATEIAGVQTNVGFLAALVDNEDFSTSKLDTGLIERHKETLCAEHRPGVSLICLAAIANLGIAATEPTADPWDRRSGYGHFHTLPFTVTMSCRDKRYEVQLRIDGKDRFEIFHEGQRYRLTLAGTHNCLRLAGDLAIEARIARWPGAVSIFQDSRVFSFKFDDPLESGKEDFGGAERMVAPMPGLVKIVHVSTGDKVIKGQALLVLEAMKMEHRIKAPHDGIVGQIVEENTQVNEGMVLVRFVEE